MLPQGKVSDIIRGVQQVEKLEVFERIANGLGLPDPARISLGPGPAPTRIPSGHPAAGYLRAAGAFCLGPVYPR